jgi:hypothetical protein
MIPAQRVLIVLASFLIAGTVSAETTLIEPTLVDSSDPVENALRENKGRATTAIEGDGQALLIGYRSSEPITIFMVPLKKDESYVPMDFMHFTVPKSEDRSVRIDLTVSPGWKPGRTKYLLNLLTRTENAEAGFTSVEFEPSSIGQIISTGIHQFFTVEPYTPSSYHALRGYRMFGQSMTITLSILTLIVTIGLFVLTTAEKRLSRITGLLVIVTLLYASRFSVDLLRFTHEHLRGYIDGQYDEAGSAHQIGRMITDIAIASKNPVHVAVCRDGTNYKEKIIKYIAYPIPVTVSETGATMALVMDRGDWSLQTTTQGNRSRTMLHCGTINRFASKLTDFPDGSILFSLE